MSVTYSFPCPWKYLKNKNKTIFLIKHLSYLPFAYTYTYAYVMSNLFYDDEL